MFWSARGSSGSVGLSWRYGHSSPRLHSPFTYAQSEYSKIRPGKNFTSAARSQNFREPLKWVDFQRICHVFPVGAARRRNGQMRAAAVLSRPDLIPLWENPVFATVCICIPISLSISTNMHLYMCILSLIVINFIQHVLSISFTLYFFAYFMTD